MHCAWRLARRHPELARRGAQALLGGGIVREGGEAGAQRLAGGVGLVEHHARAHQPDPAVGVARILAQAGGEPVDHRAGPSRPAGSAGCARAASICSRVGPGMAAVAAGRRPVAAAAAGSAMSIRFSAAIAVTASRTCGSHGAPGGASRSSAISSSTAAAVVAAAVLERRQIEARRPDCRAAARARAGTAARPPAASSRIALQQQHLAQIGGNNRRCCGASSIARRNACAASAKRSVLALGQAEQEPAVVIVGILRAAAGSGWRSNPRCVPACAAAVLLPAGAVGVDPVARAEDGDGDRRDGEQGGGAEGDRGRRNPAYG